MTAPATRKKHEQSQRAKLRAERTRAAEFYWNTITQPGWSDDTRNKAANDLARVSLRLHIFEQGRRAVR